MRIPRCFIGKLDYNKKTRKKKYFKYINVKNKFIFKFDANDLDFDDDVVVVEINVDSIGMNINDGSFGTEKNERTNVGNLDSGRSKGLNVVTCSACKENDEQEEDDDYIPSNNKGVEIY
ncbi:hypothetical protein NC651_015691 [Populus alba x Populus x berolinensis]|nr:hypothetical protein NC651_015691 [Populus alba x Populus x berolinensis]